MSILDRVAKHLKVRIAEEYATANAAAGRAKLLEGVLDWLEDVAREEPDERDATAPAAAASRAPRRDVMGAVEKAVGDYCLQKAIGPRLLDVAEGASILLDGAPLTESAAKRALDALIARGQIAMHDNRYAPASKEVRDAFAHAAK